MIRSLLSYPRMRVKAIIATLPYKLKEDGEKEMYRNYIARCLRLTAENTAKMSGGSYIKADFEDILHPKPKDTRTAEEIVADVIAKAGIEVIQ